MSRADQLAWALTRLAISGETSVTLNNGSSVSLQPAYRVIRDVQHLWRVNDRHGSIVDRLVLVETTPDGETRNHWRHTVQA